MNIFIFLLCRLLISIGDILYVCCSDLRHIANNTFQLMYCSLSICYFRKIGFLLGLKNCYGNYMNPWYNIYAISVTYDKFIFLRDITVLWESQKNNVQCTTFKTDTFTSLQQSCWSCLPHGPGTIISWV